MTPNVEEASLHKGLFDEIGQSSIHQGAVHVQVVCKGTILFPDGVLQQSNDGVVGNDTDDREYVGYHHG